QEGYIQLSAILNHKSFKGKFNITDIQRVVKNNDKQRFKIQLNPHSNSLEIKANQGHTISEVNNSDLKPILEPKYNIIVHGTYLKCWPQIKLHGLSTMKRQHIHLAKGTLGDTAVISGMRRNTQVHVYIALDKALVDGIKFYESENGVILTAGNEKGLLEPKYFSKVVNIC
ncbi:tRNA 2'-phosphotransferase 1, partial [Operophtera brumata]